MGVDFRCNFAVVCNDDGVLLDALLNRKSEWESHGVTLAGVVVGAAKFEAARLARQLNIPTEICELNPVERGQALGKKVLAPCRDWGVDFVVLARLLRQITLPDDFNGKVINSHGSLLPAFGGAGFFGSKLHSAVIASGVQITGCTVHLATDIYDVGPILLQLPLNIETNETVESLSARVADLEAIALVKILKLLSTHQMQIVNNRVSYRKK